MNSTVKSGCMMELEFRGRVIKQATHVLLETYFFNSFLGIGQICLCQIFPQQIVVDA